MLSQACLWSDFTIAAERDCERGGFISIVNASDVLSLNNVESSFRNFSEVTAEVRNQGCSSSHHFVSSGNISAQIKIDITRRLHLQHYSTKHKLHS